MNEKTNANYKARAEIIKALAHPSRLFIIDQITNGERNVQDLTCLVGADISTVSKHLAILKNAGIVKIDKRGAQVFYSIKVPCLLKFLPCVEAVLKNNVKERKACLK